MKLMQLLREEQQHVSDDNPLNGKYKKAAIDFVYRNLNVRQVTTKMYHDESWQPINSWFKQMHDLNIDFATTKSEYRHENGVDVSKTWTLEIYFRNQFGKVNTLYGRIVAAGAGSVKDPLDRYDITFSLS